MAGFTSAALGAFQLISVGKTVTFPTTFFCGLSTSDPGAGTLTYTDGNIASGSAAGEPTATTGGYQRQEVDIADLFGDIPVLTSGGATLTNDAEISFGASTAAYSSGATALTHGFIAASDVEGTDDVIFSWTLPTTITVNAANITPRFAAGSISLGGTTSSPTS